MTKLSLYISQAYTMQGFYSLFVFCLFVFFFQLEHLLWNAREHKQECSVVNHTQTCMHISWNKKMGGRYYCRLVMFLA